MWILMQCRCECVFANNRDVLSSLRYESKCYPGASSLLSKRERVHSPKSPESTEKQNHTSSRASYSVRINVCPVWVPKVLDLIEYPADSGSFLRIGHHGRAEEGLKPLRITVSKTETRWLFCINRESLNTYFKLHV